MERVRDSVIFAADDMSELKGVPRTCEKKDARGREHKCYVPEMIETGY